MGGKISNFRFIVLLVLILSIFSFFVSAGTCIYTTPSTSHNCVDSTRNQCPSNAIYNDTSKEDIPECFTGCCCGATLGSGQKFITSGRCAAYGSTLNHTTVNNPIYDSQTCDIYCSTGSLPSACTENTCGQKVGSDCLCGTYIATKGSDYCCGGSIYTDGAECGTSCNQVAGKSISGYVYLYGSTTQAISGVLIQITGTGAIVNTDSKGYFLLSNVNSNTGKITASKAGYKTVNKSFNITSGSVSNFKIDMVKEGVEDCSINNMTGFRNNPSLISQASRINFDSDGCAAAYDSDCAPNYINESTVSCSDNVDNDCDGFTDCEDLDCAKTNACTISTTTYYCGDGKIGNGKTGSDASKLNSFGTVEVCDVTNNVGCTSPFTCSNDCSSCVDTTSTCGNGIIDANEICDYNDPSKKGCTSGTTCNLNCECSAAKTCGNGVLDLPQEQCEFSLSGNSVLSDSACSFNQCIPKNNPGACLCRSVDTCGNGQYDNGKEACDSDSTGTIQGTCKTGVSCDLSSCTCTACSDDQKTPKLEIKLDETKALLNWTVECGFEKPSNYVLKYCETRNLTEECTPNLILTTTENKEYTDSLSNIKKCYFVTANYLFGNNFTSNKVCTDLAVIPECSNEDVSSYCIENSVFKCIDGKKQIEMIGTHPNNCSLTPDYTCITSNLGNGLTRGECVHQSDCELCNGWFSMYASLGLTINDNLGGNLICKEIASCYMDYTKTSVDKYNSCDQVSSCYNYNSEYACNEDKCGMMNCEWKNLTESEELGLGVCRPKKETGKQNCNLCKIDEKNDFFGACTKEYCMLFGDECYFDDSTSSHNGYPGNEGCLNKYEMSCERYGNEQDCIGNNKINSSLDVLWKIPTGLVYETPVSGTNYHETLSNDILSFSYCRWTGNICFKDGDGDKKKDCVNYLSNELCYKDFNLPVSEISFSNPQKKMLNLEYSIFDNESNESFLHYKVVPEGQNCYPDSVRTDTLNILFTENITGLLEYEVLDAQEIDNNKYTLCYFSEDRNKNFEVVKSTSLIVDNKLPEINYVISISSYELKGVFSNGEDYVYLSNVTINSSTHEDARCKFWLTRNDAPTVKINNEQIPKTLNSTTVYTKKYVALEDGAYTYHAECKDKAGNLNSDENQILEFTLDADMHITNLLPNSTFGPNNLENGIIKINLSVQTNDSAICKYDEEYLNFSNMHNNFDITGSSSHSKSIEYNDVTSEIKAFYVKCNFTTENRVYGNKGDRIIFAKDFNAPKTFFIKSNKNFTLDGRWFRKSELSGVKITCEDKSLLLGGVSSGKNYAAGCKEVYYSITTLGNNITFPIRRYNTTSNLSIPTENGIYILSYLSVDKVGNNDTNSGKPYEIPLKIDDKNFNFSFSIYDNDKKQGDVKTITKGRLYIVDIYSNKGIPNYEIVNNISSYDIVLDNVGFNFKGKTYTLSNVTRRIRDVSNDSSSLYWTAKLYLSSSNPDFVGSSGEGVTGEAEFIIKGIDSHNIESTSINYGKKFNIDTTPPSKPTLDPDFDATTNGYETYYGNIFHVSNGTYYTRDQNLFVSGKSEELGVIKYFLNNIESPYANYSMSQNAESKSLIKLNPSQTSNKLDNKIIFSDDLSIYNNKYLRLVNYDRINYTHYKEYYKISSIKTSSSSQEDSLSYIYITPELESTVLSSIGVEFYSAPHPYNWFGLPLNLSIGKNNFSVKLFDDIGNKVETKEYNIIYDPYQPEIVNMYPKNRSIIAVPNATITIYIKDIGSGLEINDKTRGVVLKINGTQVTPNITLIKYEDGAYYYNITYKTKNGLSNGKYYMSFESMDMATNRADLNWSFELDSNAPSDPLIRFDDIPDENYVSGYDVWYMNRNANFTLNYLESVNITIERIDLYTFVYSNVGKSESGPTYQNITNCELIGFNYYHCSFKNISQIPINNQYALRVYASKTIDGVIRKGMVFKYFVIDTIPPNYILEYDNTTNSNANLTLITKVLNNEKFLNAFLQFEGQSIENLTQTDDSIMNEYIFSKSFGFMWNVIDVISEDYNFTFILKDKAGNTASSVHRIRIDNEAPLIVITNFTVLRKFEKSLNVDKHSNLSEINENIIPEENVRFNGDYLQVLGMIAKTTKYNDYDIKKITVTKRNLNGTIIDTSSEAKKEIYSCDSYGFSNCADTKYSSKSSYGKFEINNYPMSSIRFEDLDYYLLFEVEDDSENIRYFTLYLISDYRPPQEPTIKIKED